jgi:hypothetical protein
MCSFNAWNWLSASYHRCSSLGRPTTRKSMSAIGKPLLELLVIGRRHAERRGRFPRDSKRRMRYMRA